jgi:hypothetical protein
MFCTTDLSDLTSISMPGEKVPKTDPEAAVSPDRVHHSGVKLHPNLTTDHRRNRTSGSRAQFLGHRWKNRVDVVHCIVALNLR